MTAPTLVPDLPHHDPEAREILERLAGWLLAGRVPECCLPDILEHINPLLAEDDAMAAFEELAEAVVVRRLDEQAGQARVDKALATLAGER